MPVIKFTAAECVTLIEAARSGAWSVPQTGFLTRSGLTEQEASNAFRSAVEKLKETRHES